ncbi:hypothetical protein Esti_004894 [Eimeria stiedai]
MSVEKGAKGCVSGVHSGQPAAVSLSPQKNADAAASASAGVTLRLSPASHEEGGVEFVAPLQQQQQHCNSSSSSTAAVAAAVGIRCRISVAPLLVSPLEYCRCFQTSGEGGPWSPPDLSEEEGEGYGGPQLGVWGPSSNLFEGDKKERR